MPRKTRHDVKDLRAASKVLVHATTTVTGVVEAMHRTIASGPRELGAPLARPAGLLTGLVYGSVRGVTKAVGVAVDRALAQLEPLLGERTPGPTREALLAALNGVFGDALAEAGNPLATTTQLRRAGLPLEPSRVKGARSRLVVLVHGSSMTDLQWRQAGHDHGEVLERELGATAVYALYNSGRHVSTNGRELAHLLEEAVTHWPVPVKDLVLLGHSMGGLVLRSACQVAEAEALGWRPKVRALVTLGTPHQGAPLERGGAWVDLLLGLRGESAPLKTLAQLRSAGVTDLRYGSVRDEDWQGRDRFALGEHRPLVTPLPTGVACFAVAGSTSRPGVKRPLGDGLVPVASALGRHADATRTLAFPAEHQRVVYGCNHLDLLFHPEVTEALHQWLRDRPAIQPPPQRLRLRKP